MTYVIIGLLVGMIMGLTGAGGALVSIPLFIQFADLNFKAAILLSLITVIIGTGINLMTYFRKVEKDIVISFSIVGIFTNYFALGLKRLIPDLGVVGLLTLIALYSIWSVWRKPRVVYNTSYGPRKIIAVGMFMGLITTLTGLGGGVLLIPVLMRYFGKSYEEALPTSLGTIFIISLSSFLFQMDVALKMVSINDIIFLLIGGGVSFYLLKTTIKMINSRSADLVRKITFSMIALYSIISVIVKEI